MKLLLIASLTLMSLSSMAMHHENKEEMKKKWDAMSFEDAKKYKTEMLAHKKMMIEEAQSCVDKSTDKKAIEKCFEKMHSGMDHKKK